MTVTGRPAVLYPIILTSFGGASMKKNIPKQNKQTIEGLRPNLPRFGQEIVCSCNCSSIRTKIASYADRSQAFSLISQLSFVCLKLSLCLFTSTFATIIRGSILLFSSVFIATFQLEMSSLAKTSWRKLAILDWQGISLAMAFTPKHPL